MRASITVEHGGWITSLYLKLTPEEIMAYNSMSDSRFWDEFLSVRAIELLTDKKIDYSSVDTMIAEVIHG